MSRSSDLKAVVPCMAIDGAAIHDGALGLTSPCTPNLACVEHRPGRWRRGRGSHGRRLLLAFVAALLSSALILPQAVLARVTLLRAPDGGIQPQAAVDVAGRLHLIYFKGAPEAGDIYYVHRNPGQTAFSPPVRVNSQPGSAIAIGTIRGAQLAIGRNGRVHVVWNGSDRALPRGPHNGSPLLYSRLNDAGNAFEPQRCLMRFTFGLDGGGTVAADSRGDVYAAWHGRANASAPGEAGRQVWIARSSDDGKTFSPEAPAYSQPTGACGCCGMRALAAGRHVYLLYRAATANVERGMVLLISSDRGVHFTGDHLQRWHLNACPMSSAAFAHYSGGVLAAWETKGQVYFSRIDPATQRPSVPVGAPGPDRSRQHPAVAGQSDGDTILVWTEGTGWLRGGSLAWQVYGRTGHPTPERGRLAGAVPVWSLPTVVPNAGGFLIIY